MMRTKQKVKMKDISDALEISIVSVSNALHGKQGVSDEIRDQVLLKAKELGYNAPASKNTNPVLENYTIGILLSKENGKSIVPDTYGSISIQTINQYHDLQKRNLKLFPESDVAGVLIFGKIETDDLRALKKKKHVPVVCVGSYDCTEDEDYVISDDFRGMCSLVKFLISEGYHSIALKGDQYAGQNNLDRYLGCCMALEKAGISGNNEKEFDAAVSMDECNAVDAAGTEIARYDVSEKEMLKTGLEILRCRIETGKKAAGIRTVAGAICSGPGSKAAEK